MPGCRLFGNRKVHDVVVLGAGISGLTAGRELVRAGVDTILLEARDSVGGRMHTLSGRAGHGLELGAQMVHGSRASTWALIREFGVKTRPLHEGDTWDWRPGKGFQKRAPDLEERLDQRVLAAYRQYGGKDLSYREFLASTDLNQEEQGILLQEWEADPGEVSLRAAVEDQIAAWGAYFDQNFQIVGGYEALPQKLAEGLGERVHLSCPVRQVEWRRGSVRITYERRGSVESVEARRALVTLPVSILKTGRPVFLPGVPAWKRQAVDALVMGRVVVVHLLFDDWFWRDRVPGPAHWHPPGEGISFYDPHPPGTGMPALEGWITGSAAQQLSDLGPEAGLERVLSWIEEPFPGARKRLEWSHLQDWVRDPYSLGSYSYPRRGGYERRAALATPIEECLYFAGEATAPACHYATVHGAYTSGLRASLEILASLGSEAVGSRSASSA